MPGRVAANRIRRMSTVSRTRSQGRMIGRIVSFNQRGGGKQG